MTLRNEYKQKTPMLREAEERALPIYVLKSNTMPQMQSSLTSIFSLEIDPREAALRETEEAIGLVLNRLGAGRAVAAERLHPAAPAPDGGAGEPRLAVARPGAVPAGPPLSGRRAIGLAVSDRPGDRGRPARRPPDLHPHNVVIDCADHDVVVPFWEAALGWTLAADQRPVRGPSAARRQRRQLRDPVPAGARAEDRQEPRPHRLRRRRHGRPRSSGSSRSAARSSPSTASATSAGRSSPTPKATSSA